MAIESELMSKAKTEGISMPGQETATETPVAKEAAPTPAAVESTPAKSESTPAVIPAVPTEPKQRFEDNPGFKNVLRQRDSFKEELKKAQEQNQKLMDMLNKPQSTPAPNEQEAAITQLRQVLGYDKLIERLESLDKRNSEYSQRERDSAFDKEQEGIIKQCEKMGLNFNEVVPQLQTWLEEHPYFGKVQEFQPGFYDIAFKAIHFDKSFEVAKKAALAEQLRETEKLRKSNSESPSPVTGNTPRAFTGVRDLVKSRIEEGGGVSFPGR